MELKVFIFACTLVQYFWAITCGQLLYNSNFIVGCKFYAMYLGNIIWSRDTPSNIPSMIVSEILQKVNFHYFSLFWRFINCRVSIPITDHIRIFFQIGQTEIGQTKIGHSDIKNRTFRIQLNFIKFRLKGILSSTVVTCFEWKYNEFKNRPSSNNAKKVDHTSNICQSKYSYNNHKTCTKSYQYKTRISTIKRWLGFNLQSWTILQGRAQPY